MSGFYEGEECNKMNEMKEISVSSKNESNEINESGNNENIGLESSLHPHYRRLTFISMNACDFCTNVTKPGPYMHYLSFETKNGWVSCGQEECKRRGKQAVEAFMENEAYGRANHLKDRTAINVKRTSGQIENNWILERLFPEVQIDNKGEEKVCVTKPSECIEKWVSIDNLLSWNADELKNSE
jgi:hypothetical protein